MVLARVAFGMVTTYGVQFEKMPTVVASLTLFSMGAGGGAHCARADLNELLLLNG